MRVGTIVKLVATLVVFGAIFLAGFTAGGMVTSNGMIEASKVEKCLPAQDVEALKECSRDGEAVSAKEPKGPAAAKEEEQEPADPAESSSPQASDQGGEEASGGSAPDYESMGDEESQEAYREMDEEMSNYLREPDGEWYFGADRGVWEFFVADVPSGEEADGDARREPQGTWEFDYDEQLWKFTAEASR